MAIEIRYELKPSVMYSEPFTCSPPNMQTKIDQIFIYTWNLQSFKSVCGGISLPTFPDAWVCLVQILPVASIHANPCEYNFCSTFTYLLAHYIQKRAKRLQPYGSGYRFTTRRLIYLWIPVIYILYISLALTQYSVDPTFGLMSSSLCFRYVGTSLFLHTSFSMYWTFL